MNAPSHPQLALRRLGIDTYQEPMIYMHADCAICRFEGFAAQSRGVAAAASTVEWIAANVDAPLLLGPDAEAAQWVARLACCPFAVVDKQRHGDREGEVSVPQVERWRDRSPLLVIDLHPRIADAVRELLAPTASSLRSTS